MGKRATDTSGPTPGERVEKWLTNIKTAMGLYIALGGLALYGNNDIVKNKIDGWVGLKPVDGIVQPASGNFEADVRKSINDIVDEITRLKARDREISNRLLTEDEQNTATLEHQIKENTARINAIRKLVQ